MKCITHWPPPENRESVGIYNWGACNWQWCIDIIPDSKDPRTTSIRHRPDTFASDRCQIDGDPRVFAIWNFLWKRHGNIPCALESGKMSIMSELPHELGRGFESLTYESPVRFHYIFHMGSPLYMSGPRTIFFLLQAPTNSYELLLVQPSGVRSAVGNRLSYLQREPHEPTAYKRDVG